MKLRGWAAGLGIVLGAAVMLSSTPATGGSGGAKDSKYVGAAKCKNCHKDDAVGNQYGAWENAAHSKAFETLASDAAKKIAADMGIEDAQTSEKCLKCHTTAFGVDAKMIKKGFKTELGVQCESCHGPGDDHIKARFKAAAAEEENPTVPEGEIVSMLSEETCKKCHNEESPTFKAFCYNNSLKKIAHPNPKKAVEAKAVDCKSCHDPIPEAK